MKNIKLYVGAASSVVVCSMVQVRVLGLIRTNMAPILANPGAKMIQLGEKMSQLGAKRGGKSPPQVVASRPVEQHPNLPTPRPQPRSRRVGQFQPA